MQVLIIPLYFNFGGTLVEDAYEKVAVPISSVGDP
jgi:hypothetical protein